jgi:hypothetical protein
VAKVTDLHAHSCDRSFQIAVLAALLAVVATAMTVAADNSQPEVTVTTPVDGARLGLTVTVSGKATDAEGFNFDSYVQARWNDWEWFLLPNTPSDGNGSIVFGEMVNLDFHPPGEHLLQVRAFDGEHYSEVAEVSVTVRDLPDLVILPTDITVPDHAAGDGTVDFHVAIENQGGEDVPDVEVILLLDGVERKRVVLGLVAADSRETLVLRVDVEPGRANVTVSAHSLQTVEERSLVNNEAGLSFTFEEPEDEWSIGWGALGVMFAIAVVLIWLGMFLGYRSVVTRKD